MPRHCILDSRFLCHPSDRIAAYIATHNSGAQNRSLKTARQSFSREACSVGARRLAYFSCKSQPQGKAQKLAKELSDCRWSAATIIENKAVSLDGSIRTLVLSVEDKVVYLEGRSMHRKQERPRWADTFQVPGQFVAIREGSNDSAQQSTADDKQAHMFAITSSPYAVRRDSADLDASLIEILVDRRGEEHEQQMADLGPGHLLEVSSVIGRGFCSLFNSYVGLLSTLEDRRDLCLIGTGCRGIAALRSVLEWTPVQAHATAHKVALFYACSSATSAAFIKDWDSWREAGIVVTPVYVDEILLQAKNGTNGTSQPRNLEAALLGALLSGEHGLAEVMGSRPHDASVLMAGIPGSVAAAVSRELTARGIERERVLFCDYL